MSPFHGYTGQPSTRRHGQKNTFTQADTRHSSQSYDQHGREWSWEADNRSGMPASPLTPIFSAPWVPDLSYIRVNPDNTNECYIDYPLMYRERKDRLAQYHRDAVRWCMENGKPTPERGEYPEYIQASSVGAPPRALELVAAAMQENPWVLGFAPKEDKRLVRFLEHRYTSESLEEISDVFNFGADSYYEQAEGQAAVAPKQKPAKYRTFEDFAASQGIPQAAEDSTAAAGDPLLDDAEAALEAEWNAANGEAQLEDGDEETELVDDEDEDAEALGGRTVNPKKSAIVAKQAPKRTHQKKGATPTPARPKSFAGGRPSLADGAIPYTGGDPRA